MTMRKSRSDDPDRVDSPAEQADAFGGGKLWIGQHGGDQDILILDPEESDSTADVLTLYSLTHHRTRRFPRSTVRDRIHAITDELARARAKKEYAERAALRDDHQRTLDEARAERMDRLREGMIAAHERYIGLLGLEYQGVKKTATDIRGGRNSKCHLCEIALDDFVGVTCGICAGVLCSCGACTCGKPARGRRAAQAAATDAGAEA